MGIADQMKEPNEVIGSRAVREPRRGRQTGSQGLQQSVEEKSDD